MAVRLHLGHHGDPRRQLLVYRMLLRAQLAITDLV